MLITEKIVDVETGIETLIEKQLDAKDVAEFQEHKEIMEQIATENAAKEAARIAILEKLGLTADEAAALLG